MNRLTLKRDPVWLDCLPTSDVSATLLLIGGDGQQVAVPVPLLLAVSPVVRRLLTDHLPPAYSPCCLSLPATTGDVLQVFRDILATGAAVGAPEDKIDEVRQIFNMLGVEATIVSCHLESIRVGIVLDRDIKKERLDEENTCETRLEITVKIEPKEESDSFEIVQPFIAPKSNSDKPSTSQPKSPGSLKCVSDKISIPCDICANIFSSKRMLKIHIDCVHNGKHFFCNICQKRFIKKAHLSRHVKSVHEKIEIPCTLCPKKFRVRDSLLMHVKAVHEKIQECCFCTQKFTLKRNMENHVKAIRSKKVYQES